MKNFKLVSLVLALTMVVASAIPVFAEQPPELIDIDPNSVVAAVIEADKNKVAEPAVPIVPATPIAPQDFNVPMSGVATVIALPDSEFKSLLVKIGDSEISLNISAETLIFDVQKSIEVPLETIKINDSVLVYYSNAMTRSLPPQAAVFAILTNNSNEANQKRGVYYTVNQIEQVDNGVRLLDSMNGTFLTILNENPISNIRSDVAVSPSDIKVGDNVVAYFDIMALSLPAQATSNETYIVDSIMMAELTPATVDMEKLTPAESIPEYKGSHPQDEIASVEIEAAKKSLISTIKNAFAKFLSVFNS